MANITIDRETVKAVVKATREGKSRREIQEQFDLTERIVAVIQSAKGLTSTRDDIVEKDKERLAKWLGR